MAFEFDKLKPEAKRAAFANMDRKRGGGRKGSGSGGSSASGTSGSAADSSPKPRTAAEKISDAYKKLATGPDEFVSLTDLRRKIGGLSREEEDKALRELSRTGKAHLAGLANRKLLTADDHDSAIKIGGEDNHQIVMAPDKKPSAAPKPGAARKKMAAAKPKPAKSQDDTVQHLDAQGRVIGRISREEAAIRMFGTAGAAARMAKAKKRRK